MLLSSYFAVTHSKSINFSNTTPNSFDKVDAVCVLKGALEHLRIQTRTKNADSVFHATLSDAVFNWFKILEENKLGSRQCCFPDLKLATN